MNSREARQAKLNYWVNNSKKLSYVPKLQMGSDKISIYRPKDFYDSSEKDPDYQSYKPIGDVVILDNNEYIKTEETEMYPKYLKKINTRKSSNWKKNGPLLVSVLVSGPDTRLPDDFELVHRSVRKEGFNAGRQGFSVWKPIAPEGYVALGDVFHNSPDGQKPNRNIIRCIPKECVSQITESDLNDTNKLNYNFITPTSVKDFNGNINTQVNTSIGEVKDTDTNNNGNIVSYLSSYIPKIELNENDRNRDGSLVNREELDKCLNKLNTFRAYKQNEQSAFYGINPEYLYNSKNYMIKDKALTLVPKEKQGKDSVF